MPVNGSTLLQDEAVTRLKKAQTIWRNADAVCFDVDSTLIVEEGIDKLAELAGVGQQVAEMTKKAMGGSMSFQEALTLRLGIIKPSESMLLRMKTRPVDTILTKGVSELVTLLFSKNISVYLVSGGFYQLIEPLADSLGIPRGNIYANHLLFNEKGEYVGFDKTRLTCQSGGKPKAVAQIKQKFNHRRVVMIGDGATDMEACPPADAFIGFGGNQVRDKVKDGAMWYVYSMKELIDELKADTRQSLTGIKKPNIVNGVNGISTNGVH